MDALIKVFADLYDSAAARYDRSPTDYNRRVMLQAEKRLLEMKGKK